MKVFISWSGPRSKQLGEALREWIHDVVQSVECFCSTDDIRAGQRWNNEVNSWLSETDFGVLCVTPENMKAAWLNFEAGALAKRISDDTRVVPVTLGFAPAALDEPLKQFNGVPADKAGIHKLMQSIGEISTPSIDIDRAFERWWPDLEIRISSIPDAAEKVAAPEPPDVAEMFSDIMASIRGLARNIDVARYSGPVRGGTSIDYEAAAILLANNEKLRLGVQSGDPGAIRFLRSSARRMARTRLDDEGKTPNEASRAATEPDAVISEQGIVIDDSARTE